MVVPEDDSYKGGLRCRHLAFYAMVLGREHSSGSRCYLCRMSAKEFAKALKRGEAWTYELMNDLVSQMQNGKPLEGCKQRARWQMIKLGV